MRDERGNLIGGVGVSADITERKRSENLLRLQSAAMMASMDGVAILDENGSYFYMNDSHAEIFGYGNPAELVGKTWRALYDEDELTRFERDIELVLREHGRWRGEAIGKRRDGSTFPQEVSLAAIEGGGIVCVVRDITERKKSEEDLRRSEERFRSIVLNVSDVFAIFRTDATVNYVNPSVRRVLGYDEDEMIGTNILDYVHPGDLERARDAFVRALRAPGVSTPQELRIRHADGSWRTMEIISNNLSDDPVVAGMVVNAHDVTARREAEEALRGSEERFRSVFEDAPIGVALVDLDSRYLRVNRQLCEMLGYPEEKLLAMTSSEVTHPDDLEISAARMRQVVGGEPGSHALEKRYVRADGRVVWVLSSVSMVETAGGEPGCFVVLYQDITERKALEEKLARQAYYDVLTGLPNRTLFMDRLKQALARMDRREAPVAVLFLDLDNFKLTNDSLGHEAGDEMLAEVARRLTDCVRPHDTVARLGGDEFTALLEGIGDRNDAIRVAERIGEALRRPFHLGKHRLVVSCSVGIVLDATAEDLPEDLLRRADLALYKAKRAGKDRYEVFEADSASRLQRGRSLGAELKLALERDEFVVLYQPKMHLRTGEIIGMEALLRWEHPERGLVSPSEFISLAEETGLIVPIGHKVLEQACFRACIWRRQPEVADRILYVNLSAKQFGDPGLVEGIERVLRETRMEPASLALEISERVLMSDAESANAKLRALRDLGVQVVVDNFGVAYSSLAQLGRFPINFLNIDRSLTLRLGVEPSDTAIVSAMIDLAHALGWEVTAEGVETADQLARLRDLGCDMAQGYHLWVPMSGEEALALQVESPL